MRKLVGSALTAWLKIGYGITLALGCCGMAVAIGCAIYAKWIHPATEFNHLYRDQIMGNVPMWGWYVVIFGFAGPFLFLLVVASLFTGKIIIPALLLMGLANTIRWLYRRLFHRENEEERQERQLRNWSNYLTKAGLTTSDLSYLEWLATEEIRRDC